jgi:hypothetical protein
MLAALTAAHVVAGRISHDEMPGVIAKYISCASAKPHLVNRSIIGGSLVL